MTFPKIKILKMSQHTSYTSFCELTILWVKFDMNCIHSDGF